MNEDKTIAMPMNNGGGNSDATKRIATPQTDSQKTEHHGMKTDEISVISASNKFFFIKGQKYEVKSNLSETSGEAQVFLVENKGKEMVLKLYYPNFVPKEELLNIIWNMQFELIVNLFDYGKIVINGTERVYELMEYLSGSTLKDITLAGNENRFCKIALAAAGALAYCHNNQIIHKDIKPGNFFFRDKEQTCLVLGDFGISSLYDEEAGLQRTTQARTPVYAAPEMYTDVIDGEVEITPKVDFYSLGITLLYLWLGHNPFSNNERSMMRMKSEGKLPHLDKLPVYINKLIRGLTCVNPEHRWGYNEVERWYKGEDVPIDESSAFLRYKTFMVDPDKNIVAHSANELAPLLYDNKELGIRYLYSGRITRWLEECGNPKLAALLEDIVEHLYPTEQQTGLMAAIYTLCPAFPYHDIKGTICTSIREITMSLLGNVSEYGLLLQNGNNDLYLYLQTHCEIDLTEIKKNFTTDEPRIAVWKLIYAVDKEMPFLPNKQSATIDEIIASLGSGQCSPDEWLSITDGRLLAWAQSHADVVDIETIATCMEKYKEEQGGAHIIFYHLRPSIAYDLRGANSPKTIAAILNGALRENQQRNGRFFEDAMYDFTSAKGRLRIYAKIQGWNETIEQLESIIDNELHDRASRHGNFDLPTAMYKLCVAMGGRPTYTIDEHEITDYEDLRTLSSDRVREESRSGHLNQWLATFFHESPKHCYDSAQDFVENLTQYVEKIGEIDRDNVYYRRYIRAKELSDSRKNNVGRMMKNVESTKKSMNMVFHTMAAISLLIALFYGVPKELHSHIGLFIGIPIAIGSTAIAGTKGYFSGNGILVTIICGIVGALSAYIPTMILEWVIANAASMTTLATVAIIATYVGLSYMVGCNKSTDRLNTLKTVIEKSNEDENSAKVHADCLYYTFKSNNKKFKSSSYGVYDDISSELKLIKNDCLVHYTCWCLMMMLITLSFVLFHPSLSGQKMPNTDNVATQLKEITK